MQGKVVWQQDSPDPNSVNYFAEISQWWTGLNNQEISWQQRLIAESGPSSDLNWEPQRFDETFQMLSPEVRGITLYWRKLDAPEERNTTPHKLELDALQQTLYIYPQTQRGIVIRVTLPQAVYQQITVNQPQITLTQPATGPVLMVRDEAQRLEIQIQLSPATLADLRRQLS